ncbi:MAG TPA: methyltransferase regulatory domain-containing protein [Rhizomicrobium sp.]
MNTQYNFSPIALSYVGALRNLAPRKPGEAFTYALVECRQPEILVCLAASNPEGRFYGLVASDAELADATKLATTHGVNNVTFLHARPSDLLATAGGKASLLPQLNYLCCDERGAPLAPAERAALFDLAQKLLLPQGLLSYSYRAYSSGDGALRFLVREFAPEMDAKQATEFLGELKQLGPLYFAKHAEDAAQLENAIKTNHPDGYFAHYDNGEAHSLAFDTIVALRPRGFAYVGDANVAMNYIELSAPASAHKLIVDCSNNPLYEPIKDFALDRLERCDIWSRPQQLLAGSQLAALFGGFTYGITMPRSDVPAYVDTHGKRVALDAPIFTKLIDVLTMMPASIGDFLAHPEGKAFEPIDIVGALQILVALDIAKPMRSNYTSTGRIDIAQPRLNGSFNKHLEQTSVTAADVLLASPVVGNGVTVSAREALVLQALNRGGLANSIAALLPELQRLAKNPTMAAHIMDSGNPTEEVAHHMIEDTVAQSITRWYAYGLLAA